MRLVAKAERVSSTDRAPERMQSYACSWCPHGSVCLEAGWARTNCRTCLYVERTAANQWRCTKGGRALHRDEQKIGCSFHLFLPDLVPGEQSDADEAANTVTYQLEQGAVTGAMPETDLRIYVDGRDPKPAVPEMRA